MAAARYSQDVLEEFFGEIPRRESERSGEALIPPPNQLGEFVLNRNDFRETLREWRMENDMASPSSRDINLFARDKMEQVVELVQREIRSLGNIRLSFQAQVNFVRERNEELEESKFFFKDDTAEVIMARGDTREQIEEKFRRFVDNMQGQIESWNDEGSGWIDDGIPLLYAQISPYDPLGGGSYLPLPPDLAKKRAIINVKNKDNECIKWAIRSALFPPKDGKDAQRTSKYPVKDGINYEGITFPTPMKQIDKLEKQNRKLAITVYGWENGRAVVYRLSDKEQEEDVTDIPLMLIESGEKQHYCWVKNESALNFDRSYCHKTFRCRRCATRFTREHVLEEHKRHCKGVNKAPQNKEMPKEGENILKFENHKRLMRAPFVIYADFESLVMKIQGCERGPEWGSKSFTEKTKKHKACGYAFIVVRSDGEVVGSKVFRGENAVESFFSEILQEEAKIRKSLAEPVPLKMRQEDWWRFISAKECHVCNKSLTKDAFLDSMQVFDHNTGAYCGKSHKRCYYWKLKEIGFVGPKMKRKEADVWDRWIAKNQETCLFCEEPLIQKNFRDAVKDHCHVTGKFRGAAHSDCNKKLRINPKRDEIPVIFHNLEGYDAHHLFQGVYSAKKEVKNCIAKNMENYIAFTIGGLRFIDSLNFMKASLDSLVKAMPKEQLKITEKVASGSREKFELICKKGIYPYEYMDGWGRFEEASLPGKEKFYSSLKDESITGEEYEHAQKVWTAFECQTLGDYHDLYVDTDVRLLADVFENFRNLCQEHYRLDPAHYYTSPGLSWDALLKSTRVELELLTDYEMHLFVERGMRGGICMAGKRYAKANNPYVAGFDPSKPSKFIAYEDANNLYGWAMSKPLPTKDFKWKRVMPTEEEILAKKENARNGWILEVDLEYPPELHKEHNGYPLAPEKMEVKREWMSSYQKRLIESLGLNPPKNKKLMLTLKDKEEYIVHYENLQFYLKMGMKLKRVHRVLEFEQESWMEPYIRKNTEYRKRAESEFEKDFYKLMNNSVFGKTMENLQKRIDIKIVRSDEKEKIRKLVAKPAYARHVVFTNNLAGVHMRKTRIFLNKPVYVGMTILEKSKLLMYGYFYGVLKKEYGAKCELLYTDTDSFVLEVETEDFYKDMERRKELYDTSNYPKEDKLHSNSNKKVLGKMKDEGGGVPVAEFVALKAKMYSMTMGDEKSVKKAKGVKRSVVKKEINSEQFKEALFGGKLFRHGMEIIRSEGHELFNMRVNKISLSPFDSKRWIDEDGIHTRAYGYKEPEEGVCTEEWFAKMEDLLGEVYTDEELSELLGW